MLSDHFLFNNVGLLVLCRPTALVLCRPTEYLCCVDLPLLSG